MNNDILILMCRGESIYIKESEIQELSDNEWFLSILLKYKKDDIIEIGEEKQLVLSIIESLRYNKLILLKYVSLDLMKALCDKWCCPEWLIHLIGQRLNDEDTSEPYILSNYMYTCKNCSHGFKIKENTSTSCNFHSKSYDSYHDLFPCCGLRLRINNNQMPIKTCSIGYHIPSPESLQQYVNIKKSLEKTK